MKKFLAKLLAYGLLLFVLGNILAFGANYFLKKSTFYKPSFLVNAIDSNKKLDYIVLGSSRGLTTLDTNQIDDSLSTKGLNLSMDDTDLKTHLLMLQHFFKSGYTADYCVLTLDDQHFTLSSTSLGNNDYRFMPFGTQEYVHDHFSTYEIGIVRPLTWSNYLPLFGYSYYNLELFFPSINVALQPNKRNRFDDKGNYSYPNSIKEKRSDTILVKSEKHRITNRMVNELISLAQQNKCIPIIYIAPYQKKNLVITSLPDNAYLINHSNAIKTNGYFYDPIHVNKAGREITSSLFEDEFREIRKD
ncbi:hypothetical protein GCM10009117_18600 [Gangjinia marincola]|uniref:Uncharacterized protein n=1 Tax=Gangjinia marincola TaxID=578463 RepID=A0ABN1MHS9_9FLAO